MHSGRMHPSIPASNLNPVTARVTPAPRHAFCTRRMTALPNPNPLGVSHVSRALKMRRAIRGLPAQSVGVPACQVRIVKEALALTFRQSIPVARQPSLVASYTGLRREVSPGAMGAAHVLTGNYSGLYRPLHLWRPVKARPDPRHGPRPTGTPHTYHKVLLTPRPKNPLRVSCEPP